MKKSLVLLSFLFTLIIACEKEATVSEPLVPIETITEKIDVGGYALHTQTRGFGPTTVVFEAGAGDDSSVWTASGIFNAIADNRQAIVYNRAGYAPADLATGDVPRDINQLVKELHEVISQVATNDKVILVGHSLGGAIVRAYAIAYPQKVEAILFVDPSHEDVENEEDLQEMVDELVPYLTSIGQFGLVKELEQLVENYAILKALPNLPAIPITVLTSLKVDEEDTAEDKEAWQAAHATLEEGVSDFRQYATNSVGHAIHEEDPAFVIKYLEELIRFVE